MSALGYCLWACFSCHEQKPLSSELLWCVGFSLRCVILLQLTGSRQQASVVVAQALSCPEACRILVPGPEIQPVSPALAGKFLTTEPPGKS